VHCLPTCSIVPFGLMTTRLTTTTISSTSSSSISSSSTGRLFCQFIDSLSLYEFVDSIVCRSSQSVNAVAQEVAVSVVDMSQSRDQFDIRGSATSSPRSFAYKVIVVGRRFPIDVYMTGVSFNDG